MPEQMDRGDGFKPLTTPSATVPRVFPLNQIHSSTISYTHFWLLAKSSLFFQGGLTTALHIMTNVLNSVNKWKYEKPKYTTSDINTASINPPLHPEGPFSPVRNSVFAVNLIYNIQFWIFPGCRCRRHDEEQTSERISVVAVTAFARRVELTCRDCDLNSARGGGERKFQVCFYIRLPQTPKVQCLVCERWSQSGSWPSREGVDVCIGEEIVKMWQKICKIAINWVQVFPMLASIL